MKLSIIIPTLNEEKYLPILLSEIKKQNFKDFEIIVADAGSKDKTLEIAKSSGCKIVKGGLPAKGRNEGAKIAQGDLLLFTDADNIYLPENFFERAISEFKRRNLGAAGFPFFVAGNVFDKMIYRMYNFWAELTQKFLPHAFNTILVRREVHEKIRGFDEQVKIAEDHDYVRRAAKVSSFGFIKTQPILTSARRHETDGRFRTYLKYFLAELWMMFFGPIKSDVFKYRFDYPKNKKI